MYAQTLSDQIVAQHPELLSVTFHGVPPGMSKVYTMFAGSYPDRIGNPDDPDDVMVSELGGENVGLLVLAYKNPAGGGKTDQDFFLAASALRDDLQKQIPNYAALFAAAK
ncbi:MAG: hypothetical protein E6K52_09890 [Gammaproteobacteria bacterium]|nr:MAG: hypothetical protein E6K52_09890 [Gammaproteobacteria bacterium]